LNKTFNLAFSMLEAVLYPRELASILDFLNFELLFKLDPEPERISVPVPLKQKVAVLRFRLLEGVGANFDDGKNSCLWVVSLGLFTR
jgi:hypothetical protein